MKRKPWFIIRYNNTLLTWFKGLVYLLTVPNVCFNVFVVAFGINWTIYNVANYMDILYGVEILLSFITSYLDQEYFFEEYSLRKIATNYIRNGPFLYELIATIPFGPIVIADYNNNILQDLLVLKLLRIIRLTHEDPIYLDFLTWLNSCVTRDQTRSERISSNLRMEAVFKILQLVSITIIAIYLFGLLWYRFSLRW